MRTLAAALASACLLAIALATGGMVVACGGHSSASDQAADAGTTAVEGTVNGVSLAAASAVAIPDNSNATGGPTNQYTTLALGIANKALTCTSGGLPNGTILGFSIIAPGTTPVGPGAYEINLDSASATDNVAALVTTDATCTESPPAGVIGGTVRIFATSATLITGSFSLAFDSGEAMQGTFAATVCSAVPAWLRGAPC